MINKSSSDESSLHDLTILTSVKRKIDTHQHTQWRKFQMQKMQLDFLGCCGICALRMFSFLTANPSPSGNIGELCMRGFESMLSSHQSMGEYYQNKAITEETKPLWRNFFRLISMFQNTQTITADLTEFVSLPKNGERVQGLSRSTLYKLITPSSENGFKPLVRSISVKTSKYAVRGRRLIHLPSLLQHLQSLIKA